MFQDPGTRSKFVPLQILVTGGVLINYIDGKYNKNNWRAVDTMAKAIT